MTYSCQWGYQIAYAPEGEYNQSITCEINNSTGVPYWKGYEKLVSCMPIYCDPPPAILNADIPNINFSSPGTNLSFGNLSSYFIETKLNYSCLYGYRFQHSEQLSEIITCKTVSYSSHIAKWDHVNISCIRMISNSWFLFYSTYQIHFKIIFS